MAANNANKPNNISAEAREVSAYDPKSVESRIYAEWLKRGFFEPQEPKNLRTKKLKNYTILLPPPNITGSLHMGHALNATISDILIRYHRMKGFRTAWLPGIDHAGIAAQNVVEKNLRKENISRFELGRDKFIEKVWEWKNKYGNIILDQLKRLGASADWSRTRFTMDPAYSEWVLKAFIHYYEKGLIYRGKRLVSWCVRCGTSLSDLEIEYKEEAGKLYFIRYPHLNPPPPGGGGKYIIVATTRPETMLGDAAVAVNPKDKRYKKLIGQRVKLPIVNREIPIIGDASIDMEFGTGMVKVTPAHDATDALIGARHNLPNYEIMNERGRMQNVGAICDGLKVAECREKVVAELQSQNLIEKIEDYKHNVAKCYRCDSTLEPLLSNQWFMKMEKLAAVTAKTVKSGKTKILPKNFSKPFFAWLQNIKDWCVSRQIWWGHQLPVYFCAKNKQEAISNNQLPMSNENQNYKIGNWKLKIGNSSLEQFIVSLIPPKRCPFCGVCEMQRSGDVLDTWFSSALWPFAGLSEADLKQFYPSDVLITARDIINLWVGRMIFSGLEFMGGKAPFATALIHATVLAKDGRRMSKSLGTGVDPLELVEKYGADATRFGIVWQAMGGQDVRWDEAAVQAGKKFANKIWNAGRFVLGRLSSIGYTLVASGSLKPKTPADKKILVQLRAAKKKVDADIKKYEFGPALHVIYDFFWHDFCDVYLEASKNQQDNDTNDILAHVLFESLKLLHPFMPHITEEIYQKLPIKNKNWLIVEEW
jgi:valyl-tRNA synthetase